MPAKFPSDPDVPSGLNTKQLEFLRKLYVEADPEKRQTYLYRCKGYHYKARESAAKNPVVNHLLAGALVTSFEKVLATWDRFPDSAQRWLLAAMLYFCRSDDAVPDFSKFSGFEDDAHILNACLAFAKRSDLAVDPKKYE